MSHMTQVDVTIEHDDGAIFGDAAIPCLDLIAGWGFNAVDGTVGFGTVTIEGREVKFSSSDALYTLIHGRVIDAVTAYLGRAELAGEVAKDEATDMAIDEMIERRHSGNN